MTEKEEATLISLSIKRATLISAHEKVWVKEAMVISIHEELSLHRETSGERP